MVEDKREWYYTPIENDILDDTEHFEKVYDKIVYIAISRFKNISTHQAFPSIKRLAKMCFCSENVVRDSIKRLEELKLIEVIRRKNESGNNEPNIYRLLPIPESLRGTSPHEVGTSSDEGGVLHDMKEGTSPGEDELEKVNYININYIYSHWNSKEIIIHKKINDTISKHINARLKEYSVEELKEAIDNYKTILEEEKYFLNYKWTLSDFMKPNNVSKFMTNSDPFTSYLSNQYKKLNKPQEKPKRTCRPIEELKHLQWKDMNEEERLVFQTYVNTV